LKKKEIKPQKSFKTPLFIAIFIFAPFVLLAFIELIFNLAGAGFSTAVFRQVEKDPLLLALNPELYEKYGYDPALRSQFGGETIMLAEKPENGFRAFILGGSTAQGFPYPVNHSFSEILETAVRSSEKYDYVEVINLGASAMTSYYVADIAPKLIAYDPDLVVIYSGHNEYYGLVSESTGSSHLGRKLFLWAQEFKIFQSFLGLFDSDDQEVSDTLMARRFQDQKYEPDYEVDQRVAENFKSNIKEVVDFYKGIGVDTILLTPASNLLNMPPFHATEESDPILQDFVSTITNVSSTGTVSEDQYEALIRAKDQDQIPFRARSILVNTLQDFKSEGVSVIDTQKELFDKYGIQGVGNSIFIDHLHFNFNGQVLLADLVFKEYTKMADWDLEAKLKGNEAFRPEAVPVNLFYLPFFELRPYWDIELITSAPPFSEMGIKPVFVVAENLTFNEIVQNPELYIKLKEAYFTGEGNPFGILLEEYDKIDPNTVVQYLQANLILYPANPLSYWNLADYLIRNGNTEEAKAYVERTLAFGGADNPIIKEAMEAFGLSVRE
jgi:lysophospholipase L1-like esterase